MTQAVGHVARVTALWMCMIVGTILSGIVVRQVPHRGVADGPLPAFGAMLVVTGLGAVVVAALASRIGAPGPRKFAILFVVVFALETGLSLIEAAAFRHWLGLTAAALGAIGVGGLIRAIVTAFAASLLWRGSREPLQAYTPDRFRLVCLVVLYVLLYFAAGMFIAWRSDAVRAFYQGGVNINTFALLALQVGRGMLWTGLAALLAATLRGRTVIVASWVAAAFAILMATPLLYPNALMPWAVREVHLAELTVANAAFGLAAIMLLRRPARSGGLIRPKREPCAR